MKDQPAFVGEALAVVIAESVAKAKDGAEQLAVDYEVLPAVVDTVTAAEPGAPRIWEEAKSNVCLDADAGDREVTEAAFARAAHVVRFATRINRVTGVTMEPRAAVAEYDPATERYTLHAGSGGAVRLKDDLAKVLGVPATQVRAVMRDIGGNFGTRGMIYPEFALVAWAAKRVGRPVKWTCERHEAFVSDWQGRDLAVEAELALDKDGMFLAMRSSNISNCGAHTGRFSPLQKGAEIATSIYRFPAACVRARAVVTRPMAASMRSSL